MPVYTLHPLTDASWDAVAAVELNECGWLAASGVRARAQLCYDDSALLVRMTAAESPIRATLREALDPVCCDSCLEFFFAPDAEDARYFNFEWNPLGTLYFGFGAARPTRVRQIVKDAAALFQPHPFRTQDGWGIDWRIPFSLIRLYFPDFSPTGECAGNFYKCGDKTDLPHYLAWSVPQCDAPDFHRRRDFGTLRFA